jgi:hypothetical protein
VRPVPRRHPRRASSISAPVSQRAARLKRKPDKPFILFNPFSMPSGPRDRAAFFSPAGRLSACRQHLENAVGLPPPD